MPEFAEFKEGFYKRYPDPTVFDCDDFNLLKVVLDGLKVRYSRNNSGKPRMFLPLDIYPRLQAVKRWRVGNRQAVISNADASQEILLIEDKRTTNHEGRLVSVYFDRIRELLERNSYQYVGDWKSDLCRDFDTDLVARREQIINSEFDSQAKRLYRNLVKWYARFARSGIATSDELTDIQWALQGFLDSFRLWSNYLKLRSFRMAIFTQHYHREGMILALRRHGIQCVELQHGIIDPSDIFYVFPSQVGEVAGRALFPDQIWTFGSHWSSVLASGSEFPRGGIKECGYFLRDSDVKVSEHCDSRGKPFAILVATQTFMSDHYIRIVKSLQKNYVDRNDVRILVKPHPQESPADYDCLISENTAVVQENINSLFPHVCCTVSVYSTALFDSIRHGTPAIAVHVAEYDDYVSSILKSGAMAEMHPEDDVLTLLDEAKERLSRVEAVSFYEEFDLARFKQMVEATLGKTQSVAGVKA